MVQGEDVGPFGVIVRDRSGPELGWAAFLGRTSGKIGWIKRGISCRALLVVVGAIVGKRTTLDLHKGPRRS